MINRNLFLATILCIIAASFLASPSIASNYRDYDEDAVRAYKKAKIKTTTIVVPQSEETSLITAKKAATDYFKEHKNSNKKSKGKPEVVLLDYEPFEKTSKNPDGTSTTEVFLKIKMYNLKNPEKFIFSLNKETSKEKLMSRQFIKTLLDEDLLVYSILSEKIERKNSCLLRKSASFSYNGLLGVVILAPKLGFGYLINPPLYWLKTNSPKDIYNNISSELEDLSIGEKDFKTVLFIK